MPSGRCIRRGRSISSSGCAPLTCRSSKGRATSCPCIVGDPVTCKALTDALLERFAIYVQPINYPTVPRGTERIRLTPSPVHSEADVEEIVAALEALWAEMGLERS